MKRDRENYASRPTWFKRLKQVLKLFIPRAKFVYLGEKISTAIILSNHVGASAPLAWGLLSQRFRFWAHDDLRI